MTPEQARAARVVLNLDMKTVCNQAHIGKRTLTEFERGARTISDTTMARLKGYYNTQGVSFNSTDNGDEIIFINRFNDKSKICDANVRPKLEYNDMFHLYKISDDVANLASTILGIQSSINISRDVINLALTAAGISQKGLAAELQCSPAFISAIFLQKKYISIDLAKKVESSFGLRGMSEAVSFERNVKKLLSDMLRSSEHIGRELERFRTAISLI